jgi:cardiolipin synthase
MIHTKILIVDSQWSIVGSTNVDPRSFLLNDEVNLATTDPEVAKRLERDFNEDLKNAKEVSLREWQDRGIAERVHEMFGGLIQRQQ